MIYKAKIKKSNYKIAIIISKWSIDVCERLLKGTLKGLEEYTNLENVDIFWVPGAFEIPRIAKTILTTKSDKYDAIITLGCVIRGETTHYDYVCNEVARQVSDLGVNYNIPVIFGVLTTENINQALVRSDIDNIVKNKGYYCALAALEMIDILNQIK
ncbi:MAG: 6,7-dimethyl-8-ribityllumazine synthase [Ureaplasma sp.]|nr:6,7-dimethyl-8-ribityllumazine synthase [Ureaplasma sp.]